MSVVENATYVVSARGIKEISVASLEEASAFFEKNWSKTAECIVELDDYCGTQFTIVCDGGTFMLHPLPVSALDENTVEAIKLVTAALED